MPKVTPNKFKKQPPEGYDKIKPTLLKFSTKLQEAQSKPLQLNKPKHESTWEITKLYHQRSKYIYDLYYKKKIISKLLYDWLIKNKFADKELIAKWKKQGYENLCCLKCIQVTETNNNTTCICRVPRASLSNGAENGETDVRCITCGCRGCSSSD